MKYEDMSDGELSFKVHLVVNKIPEGYATISLFDINNPIDIMPIQIESGIDLIWNYGEWQASKSYLSFRSSIEVFDKNPYRAIAICFLKMKDAEK